MGKRIVILASGETERRALPHLLKPFATGGVSLLGIRFPPRHRALTVEAAEKLVKAYWYGEPEPRPDKFVILVDVDGKSPDEVIRPFRETLRARLSDDISATLQFGYAQWHLEAWFFADETGLRKYLGGSLGNVDASAPDSIRNPKGHLKNLLLPRAYTAVVSEEIARSVNPEQIRYRSPSFAGFLSAAQNGSRG